LKKNWKRIEQRIEKRNEEETEIEKEKRVQIEQGNISPNGKGK